MTHSERDIPRLAFWLRRAPFRAACSAAVARTSRRHPGCVRTCCSMPASPPRIGSAWSRCSPLHDGMTTGSFPTAALPRNTAKRTDADMELIRRTVFWYPGGDDDGENNLGNSAEERLAESADPADQKLLARIFIQRPLACSFKAMRHSIDAKHEQFIQLLLDHLHTASGPSFDWVGRVLAQQHETRVVGILELRLNDPDASCAPKLNITSSNGKRARALISLNGRGPAVEFVGKWHCSAAPARR